MPKKRVKKISLEKEIKKEVQEVEQWIIERKKFFIKLAWVVGLITLLIIFSHLYLRVRGVGV